MITISIAACVYLTIAAILAVLSGYFQWPHYFEPLDMWAWPLMLAVALVAAPFAVLIGGCTLFGELGKVIRKARQ